jgi:adenine-specific DNA methylase
MAPDVPLFVSPDEKPYSILSHKGHLNCPGCGHTSMTKLGKSKKKKVELALLVHPEWIAGSPRADKQGRVHGGASQDCAQSTARWNEARANAVRLLEVRGPLPEELTCPETGSTIYTGASGGTIAKKSAFACASCGNVQDVLSAMTAHGGKAPMAAYAVQAFSPKRKSLGLPYSGRFFAPITDSRQLNAAAHEWEIRRHDDLAGYWPSTLVPEGFKTTYQRIPEHGYTTFADMFNSRQLLSLAILLKAIMNVGSEKYSMAAREYILAAFQQYLRNNNMFCLWDKDYDKLSPHFSNNNYYPKNMPVENCVFGALGRGNWSSCAESLIETREWSENPWELVSSEALIQQRPDLAGHLSGKSEKVRVFDPVGKADLHWGSSTDLTQFSNEYFDLIVTDPPFGNNVQYAELADFFHVWLRLVLKSHYKELELELTPKALEAVDNPVRNKEDPQGYYQKLLTAVWSECARILKPSGLLSFTFHHSEDAPWVSVLESLFEAGFYLEAAYPIRSDETKGEGSKPGTFGSQQIEYDIIHVCRKRTEEPKSVSWGRMRREVLADVRQLQGMLENHARAGLPAADLQVIRRGKALEYFSRHYGKVYVDEGRPMSVKEALVGINQLIDEDANKTAEPPPVNAEPITRQFLRIFDGKTELARDQMQKLLRGSGIAPDEFTNRGWLGEEKKAFHLTDPLSFARDWQGKHRRRLTADLDQALVLIGACFDGSGITASDTLKNENFKPHPALKSLLEWLSKRGQTQKMRNAASRALTIYNNWADSHKEQVHQLSLFLED